MYTAINEILQTKHMLRFRADGKFRIMMISDIHGGHGFAAQETNDAIDALITAAKPDLVIIAGDICGPGVIHAETEDDVRFVLDAISEPMERRAIPWAHVFGNHDDNYGVPNAVQMPIYASYPYCVSMAGPEDIDGVGNYFLPVFGASGDDVLFGVWGLDSHHSMPEFFDDYSIPEKTRFFHPCPAASGDYDGPRIPDLFEQTTVSCPTPWDHAGYQPDVVVVNAGTNDTAGEANPVDVSAFSEGVKRFARRLRDVYPNAKLIWCYGMMSGDLHDAIREAIESLDDTDTCYMPFRSVYSEENETGAASHPNQRAHYRCAGVLIDTVSRIMGWEK